MLHIHLWWKNLLSIWFSFNTRKKLHVNMKLEFKYYWEWKKFEVLTSTLAPKQPCWLNPLSLSTAGGPRSWCLEEYISLIAKTSTSNPTAHQFPFDEPSMLTFHTYFGRVHFTVTNGAKAPITWYLPNMWYKGSPIQKSCFEIFSKTS